MDAINKKEVELVEEILKFFHNCHRKTKQSLNDLFLALLKKCQDNLIQRINEEGKDEKSLIQDLLRGVSSIKYLFIRLDIFFIRP